MIRVIKNGGSLSESDLSLISGTKILLNMMRNRMLLVLNVNKKIIKVIHDCGDYYLVRYFIYIMMHPFFNFFEASRQILTSDPVPIKIKSISCPSISFFKM